MYCIQLQRNNKPFKVFKKQTWYEILWTVAAHELCGWLVQCGFKARYPESFESSHKRLSRESSAGTWLTKGRPTATEVFWNSSSVGRTVLHFLEANIEGVTEPGGLGVSRFWDTPSMSFFSSLKALEIVDQTSTCHVCCMRVALMPHL